MSKKLLVFTSLLITISTAFAQVRLPKIFGDNMVLQRGKPIAIWGWAAPDEKIQVELHGQKKSTMADKNGNWKLSLQPEAAGGPYRLVVNGKNNITLDNVLVGDVWICSGQSNMEWTIKNSNDAEKEIATSDYPFIRHFKVPNTVALDPLENLAGGEWKVSNPENSGDFTAVGYFFARTLYNELKIPIGLINTSWGGTHVETWTSREAFENDAEFKEMIASMPQLDLEALNKQQTAAIIKKVETRQGKFSENNNTDNWKNLSFNAQNWPAMQLPGLWEQQGLDGLDGVVWFRKTVSLPAAQAGKPGLLELAMIDDADDCYVNGIKVGSTQGYNEKRNYKIPQGILKEGNNIIAVRVNDTGGGGGIYGEAGEMKLTVDNNSQSLAGEWHFQVESILQTTAALGPNRYPTLLYNGMVNPLKQMAIKGAIWYQGESNAGRAYQYRKSFPLMITDWRKQFGQGDFPFYFVQLASFNASNGQNKNGSEWAELREAQTRTLSLPHTGMAVTTDIGTANDIHPRNKQDVGKRLAAIALHHDYKKQVVYSGPMYQSMQVDGNKIILEFSHKGGGLLAKNGSLKGFEIAAADQQFKPAEATIKDGKLIVFHSKINAPVAVRYAWSDNPEEANLYNKEGFPASPFRTDDWKELTRDKKYVIGQ